MALIRAMNSAISGLRAHQFRIDSVGDNLANATTTAYKAGRVNFQTVLSQTLKYGTAPSGFLGGVNPVQIGLGVTVAETTRDFRQGELEVTGIRSDLGIDGSGFFITTDQNGQTVYSRDGTFTVNPANLLHNPSNGYVVQGRNADLSTFVIDSGGPLQDVYIPVGELSIARATSALEFDGNLNGGGEKAMDGSVLESARYSNGAPVFDAVNGELENPATGATLLTDLWRVPEAVPGPGIDLNLTGGDAITIQAKKDGRTLPSRQFYIGTTLPPGYHGFGTTLADLSTFLQRSLGLQLGNSQVVYGANRRVGNDPNGAGIQRAGTVLRDAAGVDVTVSNNAIRQVQTDTNMITEGVKINDVLVFQTGPGAGLRARVAAFATNLVANDTMILDQDLSVSSPQPQVGNQFSIHEPPGVVVGNITGADGDGDLLPPAAPALQNQNGTQAGRLRVSGNIGMVNGLEGIELVGVTAGGSTQLGSFTEVIGADGESAVTSVTVYDSLGAPHVTELTMVLETKVGVAPGSNETGNVWRFYAENADNLVVDGATGTIQGYDRTVGTGSATFATGGGFLEQSPDTPISYTLNNNGVATPLSVTPDLDQVTGFSDVTTSMFLVDQDGFEFGLMNDFSVGADGVVTGIFTNGQTRSVAEVHLARFPNVDGLEAIGQNNFRQAANSGLAITGPAGGNGLGVVRAGMLEASNVDFAKEFTTMIVSQRAFQANARMISSTDRLLEELVNVL